MNIPIKCVALEPRNLTLEQLGDNDCRFIPGDDHLFCGHPKKAGSSYCGFHHAICTELPRNSRG